MQMASAFQPCRSDEGVFQRGGGGGFVDYRAKTLVPSASKRSTPEWTLVDSRKGQRLSRPSNHATGARTRQFVVVHRLDAGLEGVAVAGRPLDQAPAAGGEVVDHLGSLQGQRVEVDHVDVGLVAGRQQAAIGEAVRLGGAAGLLGDQELEWKLRSPRAIAAPQRQQ